MLLSKHRDLLHSISWKQGHAASQSLDSILYSNLGEVIEPVDWMREPGLLENISRLEKDCLVQLEDYLDIEHSLGQQLDALDQENQRRLVVVETEDSSSAIPWDEVLSTQASQRAAPVPNNSLCKYWVSQGYRDSKGILIVAQLVYLVDSGTSRDRTTRGSPIPLTPGVKILIKAGTPVMRGILFAEAQNVQVLGGGLLGNGSGSNGQLEFIQDDRISMLKERQRSTKPTE